MPIQIHSSRPEFLVTEGVATLITSNIRRLLIRCFLADFANLISTGARWPLHNPFGERS